MALEERLLHIVTEILAIPAGLFLIYMAKTTKTDQWKRLALFIIGAGSLIVDGYLIFTWL
jgi:hypothetical protein